MKNFLSFGLIFGFFLLFASHAAFADSPSFQLCVGSPVNGQYGNGGCTSVSGQWQPGGWDPTSGSVTWTGPQNYNGPDFRFGFESSESNTGTGCGNGGGSNPNSNLAWTQWASQLAAQPGGSGSDSITINNSGSNTPDCFVIYVQTQGPNISLGSVTLVAGIYENPQSSLFFNVSLPNGALMTGNNVPTNFTENQTQSVGTDANPIQITVQNLGTTWTSNQSTIISQAGTCNTNDNGYVCPSTASPAGSSCTTIKDWWSSALQLAHISGSFGVSSNPAHYNQQTTQTCTYTGAAPACVGAADPRCQNSAACGADFCTTGNGACDGDQILCQTRITLGGCGGRWVACDTGSWNAGYSENTAGSQNVPTNATTQFTLGSLTAPGTPGVYTETWQMENNGTPFGNQMPISINITNPANATIVVASQNAFDNSPVPTSWSIFGPDNPCASSACSGTSANYGSQLPGTYTISANTPPGYVLGGYSPASNQTVGSNGTIGFTIQWDPIPTASLTATPGDIVSGNSATLTWSSTAATSCAASGGWSGAKATSGGSQSVSPTSDTTYIITCTGPGGTATGSATVNVLSASLAANTNNISSGGSATLTWSSTHATSCSAPWASGSGTSGSQVVSPTSDTTYTITCTGAAGTATAQVTISVLQVSISANPTSIAVNQSTNLTWSSNHATSCSASGAPAWSGSKPTSGGPQSVTLTSTGQITLTITCTGPGGSASNSAIVNVGSLPTVTLAANPTSIPFGQSVALTWSSTNANSCSASGDWSGAKPTSGGPQSVTPASVGTATYTLTCTGVGNTTAQQSVTVTVNPLPTVSLSVSTATINFGQSTTLSWTSANTTSCSAPWTGSTATSGSQVVTPSSSGVIPYTITCTGPGGNKSDSKNVTVNPSGNITVTSVNSVTGLAVNSSWNFFGPDPSAPCQTSLCSGTSGGYSSVITGPYTILPFSAAGYSTVACPPSNPCSQTLSANSSVSFILKWDPLAVAHAATPSFTFNAASPSPLTSSEVMTNVGTAGSLATWSAAVIQGSSWLSISPTSDNIGLIADAESPNSSIAFIHSAHAAGNVSDPVTVIANPAGLAVGTYNGTFVFSPNTWPCSSGNCPLTQVTVPVTLNVTQVCGDGVRQGSEQCDLGSGNGICQGPGVPTCSLTCQNQSCPALPVCDTFAGNPNQVIPPQSSDLNYHCRNVTSCTISGGQLDGGTPVNVDGSNVASGTIALMPATTTTYTINCQGEVLGDSFYQLATSTVVKTFGPGIIETNP